MSDIVVLGILRWKFYFSSNSDSDGDLLAAIYLYESEMEHPLTTPPAEMMKGSTT